MANVASWFEIPVTDLERAQRFYSAALETSFNQGPGMEGMAFFHMEGHGVGGHLQQGQGAPSDHGVLLYLDAPGGVKATLARVESAGGKVERPSMPIGSYGFVGTFFDSEGNRLGLHSMTE